MVESGTAPKIAQTEEGATYDAMIKKPVVKVTLKINNNRQGKMKLDILYKPFYEV